MEKYKGIKFTTQKLADSFAADARLPEFNYWISVFSDLGLAPTHPGGAYGNHSYRVTYDSFIITRTGMAPRRKAITADYCLVSYDTQKHLFWVKGKYSPSSECFLHSLIYATFPKIMVIMHGHSMLLNSHAEALGIAVTPEKFPYGTQELAHSAVQVCKAENCFFILKDHGFVATGTCIGATAKLVLRHYGKLIEHLQNT